MEFGKRHSGCDELRLNWITVMFWYTDGDSSIKQYECCRTLPVWISRMLLVLAFIIFVINLFFVFFALHLTFYSFLHDIIWTFKHFQIEEQMPGQHYCLFNLPITEGPKRHIRRHKHWQGLFVYLLQLPIKWTKQNINQWRNDVCVSVSSQPGATAVLKKMEKTYGFD